jgi:hypothetical protein
VTERHTRQGAVRGQRWGMGTLDDGDPYDALKDPGSHESANARDTLRRRPSPVLTVLGQFGDCWCGQPLTHTWPGQADGKPHPRG